MKMVFLAMATRKMNSVQATAFPPTVLRLSGSTGLRKRGAVLSSMAILSAPTYVSAKVLDLSIRRRLSPAPITATSGRRLTSASLSPEWRESRRLVSISLALSSFLIFPGDGIAGSIFDKYVKKKKLEPLEVYVPAVILTQFQIKELEKSLEGDNKLEYPACRSLLRSGPAASLRVNIRAVAQYASELGNERTASNSVDQCLRALEELDSLFLHASRNDPGASVESMKANIGIALQALDSLLQTVPADVLDKGKAVADSYRLPENVQPETLDLEMKQLESIL